MVLWVLSWVVGVVVVVVLMVGGWLLVVVYSPHLTHARSYKLIKNVQTWRRGPAQTQGIIPHQS